MGGLMSTARGQAAVAYFLYGVVYMVGAIGELDASRMRNFVGGTVPWWVFYVLGGAFIVVLPILVARGLPVSCARVGDPHQREGPLSVLRSRARFQCVQPGVRTGCPHCLRFALARLRGDAFRTSVKERARRPHRDDPRHHPPHDEGPGSTSGVQQRGEGGPDRQEHSEIVQVRRHSAEPSGAQREYEDPRRPQSAPPHISAERRDGRPREEEQGDGAGHRQRAEGAGSG